MALQSQTARARTTGYGSPSIGSRGGSRGGSSGTAARDGQRRALGIVLLALLVIGAGYWYVLGQPSQSAAPALASDPDRPERASTTVQTRAPISAVPVAPPLPTQAGTPPANAPNVVSPGPLSTAAPTIEMTSARQPSAAPPAEAAPARPASKPATTAPSEVVTDPLASPSPRSAVAPPSLSTAGLPQDLSALIEAGRRSAATGSAEGLVSARATFNRVLLDPRTDAPARAGLRASIAQWNRTLVFSPAIAAGDPLTSTHVVDRGDSLVRIARNAKTLAEPALISRVNNLANPNAIRVGQSLKVVKGPFHAVVHKGQFRMDIYAGPTPTPANIGTAGLPDGAEPGWMYITSLPVGLGESGVTPIANFLVKANSKLINPFWVNPRTGEKFDANDPKNPIGERWVGLEGLSIQDRAFTGYGIHGTIEPDSIGREMSMGCVRLGQKDVEMVYDLLMPKVSVVKIVP
jgi:LysM repeat protein